jgi:DHA2 family multidrug resistance protein
VMLDKGQEDDWFGSRLITVLAVTAGAALVGLVIWELLQKQPIVDVRLFKGANFSIAAMMLFFVGAVLFTSTVLMPQYLQTLMGYSAETAGMALSAGALIMFIVMPLVGRLTSKIQARYIIAFGWLASAASMFISARTMNTSMSFGSASWLRVVQQFPVGFIFIPATMAAYIGLPAEKSNAVAGLVNFTRNIGSSVGTSVATTVLARRAQFHQTMLANHTSLGDSNFRAAVGGLWMHLRLSGFTTVTAHNQAYARLYALVLNQSSALAYVDAYWLIAVGAGVMFIAAFFLKKNDPHRSGEVAVH